MRRGSHALTSWWRRSIAWLRAGSDRWRPLVSSPGWGEPGELREMCRMRTKSVSPPQLMPTFPNACQAVDPADVDARSIGDTEAPAAVDHDLLSGDVRGRRRGEKQGERLDLV